MLRPCIIEIDRTATKDPLLKAVDPVNHEFNRFAYIEFSEHQPSCWFNHVTYLTSELSYISCHCHGNINIIRGDSDSIHFIRQYTLSHILESECSHLSTKLIPNKQEIMRRILAICREGKIQLFVEKKA